MPQPTPVLSTVQDYLALPDDGKRYELVAGRFEMVPSPLTIHQKVGGRIFLALSDHVGRFDLGTVLMAPLDVFLDERNVVQPDILFVSRAHERRIGRKGIEGVPDLVVEILSEGTASRDCIVKRDLYARAAVPEYWIVDPLEPSVTVLALEAGAYRVQCQARGAEPVRSLVLPELTLIAQDLFG